MSAYFTCPKCQQKCHGQKNPPGPMQVSRGKTCTQCGTTGIVWVASENIAKRVVESGTSRDLIAVGVGTSTSTEDRQPHGVPFGELQTAVELLLPHATLEGYYNQLDRTQKFRQVVPELRQVKEGQCEGQCLHWIRRVLQGGKQTYAVPREKDGQTRTDTFVIERQQRQAQEGAQTAVKVWERTETDRSERKIDLEEKISQLLQTKGIRAVKKQMATAISWSYTPPETMDTEEFNSIRQWIAKARQDFLESDGIRGMDFTRSWQGVADALDSSRQRKRKFSGIVATKSRDMKPYDGNTPIKDFTQELFSDTGFRPGTAFVIGVGLASGNTSGSSGGEIAAHAIGVHYKGDSEFYLFDPNLGVFVSRSKDDMKQAVQKLIGQGWVNCLGWQLNDTFGFALFERRGSVQEVQPKETIIVTTPSPVSTYLENKSVLPQKVTGTTALPEKTPVQQMMQPPVQIQPKVTPRIVPQQPIVSPSVSSSGDLKKDLQECLNNSANYTPTFMGQKGGFIKLSPDLAIRLREAGKKQKKVQWNDQLILEQNVGNEKRYAIQKSFLTQLVNQVL